MGVLASVAGGIFFEAGMIATCTGVGLPVGLALMGVGTICTAYGSGLFGMTDTGNFYSNLTDENLADFGFSMSLNLIGGGYSAAAAKSTLRTVGGKSVQISISKAAFASDQRGAYTTFHTISSKTYIQKVENGAFSNCGEYLIEQEFGTTVIENIRKSLRVLSIDYALNFCYDFLKENYIKSLDGGLYV